MLRLCQPGRGFDGFLPQAPGRIVDDPFQSKVIEPVVDHTQIRQHILYFRPIKETGPTDYPIGDSIAFQCVFQSVGLGVGPVQNGIIPELFSTGTSQNFSCHKVAFRPLVAGFIHRNGFPFTVVRPKPLPFPANVVGNHRIGRVQDGLGGAVVLFQANGPGAGILLFKIQNILNGRAPEPVDALIIITHHTDILISPRQQRGQQILHMVGILVFIHQNVTELPLIVFPDVGILLQKLDGNINNVVKIQRIVVPQLLLIACISFGNGNCTDIPLGFRLFQHFAGRNHFILFLADCRKNIPCRKCFVIQTHIPDDFLHNPFRIRSIVDGETSSIPHPLNIPPQNPAASCMKRHGPDIFCLRSQKQGKPLLHFICSLVGEGNRHYTPGHRRFHGTQPVCPEAILVAGFFLQILQKCNIFLRNPSRNLMAVASSAKAHQIGDPVNQYRGFTAAGTGQKQQRPLGCPYRFLLHGIQLGKLPGYVCLASCQKTGIPFLCHSHTCPFSIMHLF